MLKEVATNGYDGRELHTWFERRHPLEFELIYVRIRDAFDLHIW